MNITQQRTLKGKVERLRKQNQSLKGEAGSCRKELRGIRKSLRESRKWFKEIPVTLFLIQEEKVIMANDAACEHLGYSEDELMGKNLLQLVHPDSVEAVRNVLRKRKLERSILNGFEAFLVKKSGEKVPCEIRMRKTMRGGRRVFLASIIDLHERNLAEAKRSQIQKTQALSRMAVGLVRELREWLHIFQETCTRLRRPKADATQYSAQMGTTIEVGQGIVKKLSNLAYGVTGLSKPVLFDLKEVLQRAVERTRPAWNRAEMGDEEKIQVKTYLRALSPVEGHPEKIQEVFEAIILNAVDAMPCGGEIYLTAEEDLGAARIYIQDNGEGIPDEIKEKILDPFFTTRDSSRSGLGLSLAHSIISGHGGEMEIMSQEGQGSVFIIKLPLAKKRASSKKRIKNGRIRGLNVLMVAGEGVVSDILCRLLMDKGSNVTLVYNYGEARKLLGKNAFDLVVAELKASPVETSRIIHQMKRVGGGLPVVLIGEEGRRGSSYGHIDLGADLVLERPVVMDKVLSRITETLELKEVEK